MRATTITSGIFRTAFLVALLFSFYGCGSGGGSGPASSSNQTPGQGIALESIAFPAYTDLTDPTTVPPSSAPLSQQVVFDFSGVPDGPHFISIDHAATYAALHIYALVDEDYTGPEAAVDRGRNIIPARGTFEKVNERIVFTPSFPTEPIELTPNANLEAIPGLLPDMEYIVYVPLHVEGAIGNLETVRPFVSNPVRFRTCSGSLPNLFFGNHRDDPPRVVNQYPRHNDTNIAINTCMEQLAGFPPWAEFFVEFDQPLLPCDANITGEDLDEDGADDENIFFVYRTPEFYAALDEGTSLPPAIVKINAKTGAESLVGTTRLWNQPHELTGLKSIAVDGAGRMLGTTGSILYQVDYKGIHSPEQECRLFVPRDLEGRTGVRGLAFSPDGALFGLDSQSNELLSIDTESGAVTVEPPLPGVGEAIFFDMAFRHDGSLYLVAVARSGTPDARTVLIEMDTDTGQSVTLYDGAGDYTSIGLAGFGSICLYSGAGLFVDLFDLETLQIVPDARYEISGDLDDGTMLDTGATTAELGTIADLVVNTYRGSRVTLRPSGILPFGEKIDCLIRRGLDSVSLGSMAKEGSQSPAEADLSATFFTFDPGEAPVDDAYFEDFLTNAGEGQAILEGLAPADWAVYDVDGVPPEYDHLLAGYGLGGTGTLGDFEPLGIYPTVLLDTDYQPLPLYDGSTPGVRRPMVVKGGVFNFENIHIPANVTVRALGANPLILTATGNVIIEGTIDCSGVDGRDDTTFNSAFVPTPGGMGGPGGGHGGMSQPPTPSNYQNMTDLRSPAGGERGWGYSNLRQSGGLGGESGASGTDVPFAGSAPDDTSRGAGGGGGSFLQRGSKGYRGLGMYGAVPDDPARYLPRAEWYFDDGAPSSFPDENHRFMTTDPEGGDPGVCSFEDDESSNDFLGKGGEVAFLQGGQGGGGGGSRLDSMNTQTAPLAASWFPPADQSAYDAKGGGGGGGGGGLGIYALGEIYLAGSSLDENGYQGPAVILARGGMGGGGEVIGHSNFGGGGGGGSGGAVILDAATKITIKNGATIDVSGGWPGDAKEVVWTRWNNQNWTQYPGNKCLRPANRHRQSFCCWSIGDGGYGGYGLVQLQVSDHLDPEALEVENWDSIFAELCEVDWNGDEWGSYALCDGQGPNCSCVTMSPPPPEWDGNCLAQYYHYKVIYPGPSLPRTADCLVDPAKTPTTLGPKSYALSRWIDLGQTVTRGPIDGLPVPLFEGFEGIDTFTGRVITTEAGYIPHPEENDIEVFAPDFDNGTIHYIPEENEVTVLFQGADPLVAGSRIPDPDSVAPGPSEWTADITDLHGKQFIRFRICLDTAKEGFELTSKSTKPQVNFVRIRMRY